MSDLVTDSIFDLNKTTVYKLSIQVSLDGFSFFVLDVADNRLLAWCKKSVTISNFSFIARRFEEWLHDEELFQQAFNEVEVVFFSDKFTLVPNNFFEDSQKTELLKLLHDEANNPSVLYDALDLQYKLVFSVPTPFYNLLNQKFSNHSVHHPLQRLLQGMEKTESKRDKKMALWIGTRFFYLMVLNQGVIQVVNAFSFAVGNDILYFSLSTIKQLDLAPQDVNVYLSGQMDKIGDLVVKLNKYFNQVDFLKPDKYLKYNPEKVVIPKHQLVSLF